ncbi:alpha-1B-glycoprotein [Lepus europaeus]|uniref:alpha-1B-glycoprotein n=1 Tax=Lepus europaeus TaxID=9983 RepID=UPI002B474BB9|nr:alpha-1B-glycoprotein [Lepus europaeus]
MPARVAFLLLWGLIWGPETRAATFFDPRPRLLADSTTLTCQAQVPSQEFELFKDGVVWDQVRLDRPAMEHRFQLAGETGDTHGLYRCRSRFGSEWTQLSNLLEVTEDGSLPPPLLSAEPMSWITPGLNITLLCQGARQGVTFSLKREGDSKFLAVAEAGPHGQATFPVHQAGNYSCSYRTHAAGDPSEPSATVTIEELAAPPPPRLEVRDRLPRILQPGTSLTLECVAPLAGVEFLLWKDKKDLLVTMSSTSPDRVFFHLNEVALGDSGPYTCRYRMRQEHSAWSGESAPLELVLSDGTLPAPELSAEPPSLRPAPGSHVRLRCRGPRAGLRFALVTEEDDDRLAVRALLSPPGAEASFELRAVSVVDSANYSCVYVDPAPPFAGSVASEPLELRVDGPLPRPQLRPLWSGAVTPGRDAVLRCESSVPGVAFELLRTGEEEAATRVRAHGTSADLVLPYVGPQHAGNYSCRYRVWGSGGFVSELSDPVELLVAGR